MTERKYRFIIDIFWFAVIAFLSYRMPMVVDDYVHVNSFATGERITSVSMIPASVYTYYMTWGGRALSMFFIQLMLMLPRAVYAVCNGLIYVLIVNIICGYGTGTTVFGIGICGGDTGAGSLEKVAGDSSPGSVSDTKAGLSGVIFISLVYLFIWLFMPDFTEVTIWLTGSITYLWTNTLIVLMGCVYYRDYVGYIGKKDCPMWVRIVGMIILGFFAGLSNEAGASTLLFALILYVIFMIRKGCSVKADKIAGIISCMIGTAILILAPGNRVRSSLSGAESEHGSMIRILLFRFARENFYMFLYLLIPIVICVALYLYVHGRKRDVVAGNGIDSRADIAESDEIDSNIDVTVEDNGSVSLKARNMSALFFIGLAIVGIYALTFSAGFADRIFQFPLLMLAVSFTVSLSKMERVLHHNFRPFICIIAGLMIMVLIEIIAGSLYSMQSDSYFDRHMYYYHIDEADLSGLMPGNGMSE